MVGWVARGLADIGRTLLAELIEIAFIGSVNACRERVGVILLPRFVARRIHGLLQISRASFIGDANMVQHMSKIRLKAFHLADQIQRQPRHAGEVALRLPMDIDPLIDCCGRKLNKLRKGQGVVRSIGQQTRNRRAVRSISFDAWFSVDESLSLKPIAPCGQ